MFTRLSVVAFFYIFYAAAAMCSGDDCAPQDSAEVMLATKSRLSLDHGTTVEDDARLDLPKLVDFTQRNGLPNLFELESTLDRIVSDTINKSANRSANITGYERTYDPTPKEWDALATIRGFLEEIYKATKTLHTNYQDLINEAAKQVSEVNDEFASGFALVDQYHTARETSRGNHNECRTSEATIKRTMDSHCSGPNGINTIRLKDLPDEKALPQPAMEKVMELWKSASTPGELTTLYEAIGKLSKYFSCDGTVAEGAEGCMTYPVKHDNAKKECDHNQTIFEDDDCRWHAENDEVCTSFTERFEYEKTEYYKQQVITAKSEETRKAEHVAAKRVDCYLDILVATQGNKSAMLRKCRNDVHNVDHLNIVYPQLAAKKYDCQVRGTAAADQTCGSAWVKREYTDQAWHKDATMQTCKKTCSSAAPTPAGKTPTEAVCNKEGDHSPKVLTLSTENIAHRPPTYSWSADALRLENAFQEGCHAQSDTDNSGGRCTYYAPDQFGEYQNGGHPDFFFVIDLQKTCYVHKLLVRNAASLGASAYYVKEYTVGVANQFVDDGSTKFEKVVSDAFPTISSSDEQEVSISKVARYIKFSMDTYGGYGVGITSWMVSADCSCGQADKKGPYCVRIKTGPTAYNDGFVAWKVDTGSGTFQEANKKYERDQIVTDACYDAQVETVEISNEENNAWAGSVEYSEDSGATFKTMYCTNCDAGTDTAKMVIDGNGDAADQAATTCLHAKTCKLTTAPEAKACADWDVQLVGHGFKRAPQMYYEGKWRPICGHHFWNDNNGATALCKQLGYDSGTVHRTHGTYDSDAVHFEVCQAGSVVKDTVCAGLPVTTDKTACKAGTGSIGITIECSGSGGRSSSCGSSSGGVSYRFSSFVATWDDANTKCESIGGRLACPQSEAENEEIAAVCGESGAGDCWIGGKTASGNTIQWLVGSSAFTKWNHWEGYGPEPNGATGSCISMYSPVKYPKYGGQWNDAGCSSSYKYVCEVRS